MHPKLFKEAQLDTRMKRVPPSAHLLNTHPPPAAARPHISSTQTRTTKYAHILQTLQSTCSHAGLFSSCTAGSWAAARHLQNALCRWTQLVQMGGLSASSSSPLHSPSMRTIKLKPPCYLKKNCWLFLKRKYFSSLELNIFNIVPSIHIFLYKEST